MVEANVDGYPGLCPSNISFAEHFGRRVRGTEHARQNVVSISYEPARCVVCGHADARVIAGRDDLRDEVERLWEYHQRRMRPETPPERLMDRVAFSAHPPIHLV